MNLRHKELYNKCQRLSLKKIRNTMLIPYLLLSIMLMFFIIYYGFYCKLLIESIVFACFFICLLLSYIFLPFLFIKFPYSEILAFDMSICCFVEYGIGFLNRYIVIHLVVNEQEYLHKVNLRTYLQGFGDNVGDLIDIAELTRYFVNYSKDIKSGKNLITFARVVDGKKIVAIYDKYQNIIQVAVDGKIIEGRNKWLMD